MPRNPLANENQQFDAIKGEDIVNVRTERKVRIRTQDGTVEDFLVSAHDSRPDGNGNFIDSKLINVITDRAGNLLPENPRSVKLSITNLFISSPEELAICTSRLHPANCTRNILIGQDGRETPNGAICIYCSSWQTTIYIAFAILGVGVLAGLCKAAGIF